MQSRGYDMKRRELDDGYWFVLQKRLLDSGFITVTINPGNGKNYWKPTLKGIKAYKTVLELTKRNRLFKGPKFTEEQIDEFRYTDNSSYEKAKKWLLEWNMIKPVYDSKLNDEKYELTEYAYEFFQTYSTTITKGSVNPGPHVIKQMGEAVLMAIFIVCYVIIKTLTGRDSDNDQRRRRK